jgi:hypothetical protein
MPSEFGQRKITDFGGWDRAKLREGKKKEDLPPFFSFEKHVFGGMAGDNSAVRLSRFQ